METEGNYSVTCFTSVERGAYFRSIIYKILRMYSVIQGCREWKGYLVKRFENPWFRLMHFPLICMTLKKDPIHFFPVILPFWLFLCIILAHGLQVRSLSGVHCHMPTLRSQIDHDLPDIASNDSILRRYDSTSIILQCIPCVIHKQSDMLDNLFIYNYDIWISTVSQWYYNYK